MKKNYKYLSLGLVSIMALGACSDKFLEEKRNYGNFNATDTYGSADAATERINNLYFWLLPCTEGNGSNGSGNGTNHPNDWTSFGYSDDWAKSTLEYGGIETMWVNPQVELSYENVYDHFYVANDTYSPWGHIRNCNDAIEGITASSSISEEDKNKLLGQAYFFRAYVYYSMVKLYGGVPIIDHVQEPIGSQKASLAVPRQTTKDCIDFICADLDKAASMLPTRWVNEGTDYGRITSGLAQALKGYVLLFYASPLFNRTDNMERWEAAYEANKKALELLTEGGYGLAYASNGGERNAANWNRIWATPESSDGNIREAVFVTLHNTNDNVSGQPDYGKWNRWENYIRPRNTNGGGGLTPTAEMVDLFPMADGKRPSESTITYDKKKFWLNRDPRFYRTFAFPGTQWQFNENGAQLNDPILASVIPYELYPTGEKYQLWSYQWSDNATDLSSSTTSSGFWPDLLSGTTEKSSGHSVYVRKRTLDYYLEKNTLYQFIVSNSNPKGFMKCAAPLINVRYAEVLLNYAEAAAAAGHLAEAQAALEQIRARVGYTAANNFGLPSLSSRQEALRAVLYERQIELAYEGKLFDTMRRWMLFDGGVGQESIKDSWGLKGHFGGNTCTYLNITPLNGQRRHSIVLYCKTPQATDPAFEHRPTALTLDEEMSYNGGVYTNSSVEALGNFYDTYLDRCDVNADGNDEGNKIKYLPKYYLIGLKGNAMSVNVTLHQTVGWHDLGRNADGLFDPLSDTLPE